jgi:hypothetical protein
MNTAVKTTIGLNLAVVVLLVFTISIAGFLALEAKTAFLTFLDKYNHDQNTTQTRDEQNNLRWNATLVRLNILLDKMP